MENNKKVTIIAVAKNEAAYLPEWVHHHFYFGFDKIVIGVNRTDDNTNDVIAGLNRKYRGKVENVSLDFIDKSIDGLQPRLQQIGYAYLVHREIEKGCQNEILIIDVDEYWVPCSSDTNISDYLHSLPEYDIVSFHWLFEPPCEASFSLPMSSQSAYINKSKQSHFVKTLFKPAIYDDVEIFAPHRPKVLKGYKRLSADGKPFEPYMKGYSEAAPDLQNLGAYILHRTKRSEIEYLAGQNKTDITFPNSALRPTKAYRDTLQVEKGDIKSLPVNSPAGYVDSFNNMIRECGLEGELEYARNKITERAFNLLNKEKQVLAENVDVFLHKTYGTFMFFKLLEQLESEFSKHTVKQAILAFCHKKGLTREKLQSFPEHQERPENIIRIIDTLFSV